MKDNFLGNWTLEHIASAVRSNIANGSRMNQNDSFSIEQLMYTVISVRNKLYPQFKKQGLITPNSEIYQEINCVPVDCEDLALCCGEDTGNPTLHFKIPFFEDLSYIGTVDRRTPFKIYDGDGDQFDRYKTRLMRNRPYVRFRNYEGFKHGFIFNPPTKELEFISATAIFDNPLEVNMYECCQLNPKTDRFPAPDFLIQAIIDEITSKWASYYYRLNVVANQGAPPDGNR